MFLNGDCMLAFAFALKGIQFAILLRPISKAVYKSSIKMFNSVYIQYYIINLDFDFGILKLKTLVTLCRFSLKTNLKCLNG